jgi:hypothetical protein
MRLIIPAVILMAMMPALAEPISDKELTDAYATCLKHWQREMVTPSGRRSGFPPEWQSCNAIQKAFGDRAAEQDRVAEQSRKSDAQKSVDDVAAKLGQPKQ